MKKFQPIGELRENFFRFNCIVKSESSAAWLCNVETDEPIWLPKSQVTIGLALDGKSTIIDIPRWLAKKHNLI